MANNHAADYGAVGLARHARRDPLDPVPDHRDRRRRRRGVRAVLRHGPRAPGRAARRQPDPGPHAGRLDRRRRPAPASPPRTTTGWSRPCGRPGERAEIVVVYLHWGVEGQGCPSADQRALAARLAAAGADAVVGTHAHLLLGAGYLGSDLRRVRAGQLPVVAGRRVLQRHRRAAADLRRPAGGRRRSCSRPASTSGASRCRPPGRPPTGSTRKWAGLVGCTGLAAQPG